MFKTLKFEDWLGIALGAWLLVSPWALGYSDQSAASMNALFLGCILIFLELLNLDVHEDLEERLDMAAGVWLIAAPFILGFSPVFAAAANAMAVGALTIAFAAWALVPTDEKGGPVQHA